MWPVSLQLGVLPQVPGCVRCAGAAGCGAGCTARAPSTVGAAKHAGPALSGWAVPGVLLGSTDQVCPVGGLFGGAFRRVTFLVAGGLPAAAAGGE
jgi:hypothetical protein